MIIIDISQVFIANLMVHLPGAKREGLEIQEPLLRHMLLNTIRSIKTKFSKEYGELIIACDNKEYWRRQAWPYYKASRGKGRDNSLLDWKMIFQTLSLFKDELKEVFPYRVIDTSGAEADDVIASLCKKYGADMNFGPKILIVSGDKDFAQLQKYANVKQFDTIKKKFIEVNDPEEFLIEHVIKGDSGDGIPNILSDDDVFVSPQKRQKALTEKRQKEIRQLIKTGNIENDPVIGRNYARNQLLIDFSNVPADVEDRVIKAYDEQGGKDRSKLMTYFVEHRLKNLLGNINDF